MALRVWLPLNKDIQILPVLSTSMAKESGISITEENGWFKIADASHTSSRWGAYMDFEVEPGLTYILSCDLKAGTRSAKVGFDSFAGSRSWPTDRITSSSTTGERKSYTLVTARGKYARVYFNLAPTALGDYAYFKNPTLTKITNLGISNINITEVSTSAINENTGKIGKCLTDNGTAYWAISPITLGSNCSICCWTKTSINGKMSWVLESNANATLNLYESTYYALNIGDGNSNLFKDNNGNSITCLHDGKWHHFVVTFDGTSALLYIDGEYRGKAITFRNPTTTNGRIKLGGGYNNSHSYDWNGDLNDFRIYDHCLSPLEVKEISQGLILHYKLDGFSGGAGENILPNTTSEIRTYEYPSSSFADRFAVITTKIPEAEKYTLSFYAKSTVAGDKIRAHYYSPNTTTTCVSSQGVSRTASDGNMDFTLSTDWQLYWVTYTQTSTTAVKRVILPRMGAVGNTNGVVSGTGIVSIKCVKMEEGERVTSWSPAPEDLDIDTTKIIDSSGYGNDGSIIGNTLIQSNSPRYNTSIHMNNVGTTNHIEYNALSISGAFTISFWVKAALSKNQVIFVDNGHGYEFGILNNLFYTSTTTSNGWATSKFLTNNWNHIAIRSSDGMTVELFVNGVQETSRTGAGNNYLHNQTNPWLLNRGNNSSYAADASLSDFRIYTTALSAEDVATLYHTPAQIDNLGNVHGFEMVEKQGNILSNVNIAITGALDKNLSGVGTYTQANCTVTYENNAIRIYRPPNITHNSSSMHNMWGGMRLRNSSVNSCHEYNENTDNIFGLQKNHTYVIYFTVKGQSSNAATSVGWTNQMGWGGGGLTPNPTNIEYLYTPVNFNGEMQCFYKFTISDDVVKTCTTAYSYATVGKQYLSYNDFMYGFGYENTGSLGTDVYVNNFRMFDITSLDNKNITLNGIVNFLSFNEENDDIAHIHKFGEMQVMNIIEK